MASRLIDKLLVNPNTYIGDERLLLTSYVVNATNVANYYLAMAGRDLYEVFTELPCIAPPLNKIFVSYTIKGREYGTYIGSMKYDNNIGWSIFATNYSDDAEEPFMGGMDVALDGSGMLMREDGKLIHNPNNAFWVADGFRDAQSHLSERECLALNTMSGSIALWTLAFMNCKNATLEPVEPNAAENKRRAKHGKLPLMRYHVLKIKPFGNRSDNEAQGGTHGSPALHIRRGHFKTYTDAAPLFGQFVGTYWWEQSIAGKKSNRVVVKDYEMDLAGQTQ